MHDIDWTSAVWDLDAVDVGNALGVSERAVTRYATRGDLVGIRLGRGDRQQWRFSRESLELFIGQRLNVIPDVTR